jgi:hypothetical protein
MVAVSLSVGAGCTSDATLADENGGVCADALTKNDSNNKKVEICHKAQTISVAQSAISAHLKHGDVLGKCKSTCPPKVCDDGNLCTSDTRLANGSCDHKQVSCDDGDPCTTDTCKPNLGCQSAPADGVACSDGDACTGPDSCQGGRCTGTAIARCCASDAACSDGDACTADRCSNRACSNTAIDCNVADRCQAGFCDPAAGGCSATPVSCDDGNPCTDDSCDAAVGCRTTPTADGSACQPAGCSGAACNGWICKSSSCVATVQFGPDVPFTLDFQSSSGDPVSLSFNRAALNSLIGRPELQTRVVRTVDLAQPVGNALTALKAACGTAWQFDQQNPSYNCNLTALGQTFKGADGTFESSTEYALIRALTMTPANAIVDGTSLESLKGVADSLGVGGGFNQILADTFGIARTREILLSTQVQASIITRFVASHPAAPSGSLSISLDDALNDLVTWTTRYGAIAGGHTGVVSSLQQAVLFGPGFAIDVHGTSNLRSYRGVDLSATSTGAMQRLQPPVGAPAGEGVVWDLSVAGMGASGLNAGATEAFTMALLENPNFVRTCDSASFNNCRSNTPTSPLASFVWSTPTWQLENLLAYAAYSTYAARVGYERSYVLGGLVVDVGFGGEPAGWTHYDTLFGIGSPPEDQYLWESTSEIAQVALHRISGATGLRFLAEGQANVRLPIALDVHVTADQVLSALRPSLVTRQTDLDQRALGNYATSNADVDFFAARADDGLAYLAFVSPDDPRPVAAYPYAKPGFFADANLSTPASTPFVLHAGETSHEAVRLDPGVARTLYLLDAAGALYRITATLNATGSGVLLATAKAL